MRARGVEGSMVVVWEGCYDDHLNTEVQCFEPGLSGRELNVPMNYFIQELILDVLY